MSSSWVIDETWTPMFVDSAMTGPDRTSTNAAGISVTSGASTARKASSSRTMMNRSESCDVWSCDEPVALIVSTCVASWPVRWICRPAGAPAAVEGGPDGVDHAGGLGPAAEGDHRRLQQRLARLAVARDAQVDDQLHPRHLPDLRLERVHGRVVGRR